MDRLQININGTDYNLPLGTVEPNTWTLSGWDDETQGDALYFYDSAAAADAGFIPPAPLGLSYGEFILLLNNGMYLSLTYEEEHEGYSDYLSIFGLYNSNGDPVGSGAGTSGSYSGAAIVGIRYTYGENEYIGFGITNEDNEYMIVYLFNDDIYESSIVEPYDENPDFPPTPGGWGDYNRDSDQVGASAIPSTMLPLASGINMYVLNATAFRNFTQYLWGSNETIWTALWGRFVNYRFNPIGAIINCIMLPTDFIPSGSAASGISIAGTKLSPISGTLTATTTQFVDCTYSFSLPEFYGSFMDYVGCEVILHLPFVGPVSIEPIYCVGGGITILYRCDVATGNITVFLICTNRSGRAECIRTASGNCAYGVPVTGHDDGIAEMLGSATKSAVSGATSGGVTGALVGLAGALEVPRHETSIIGNHSGSSAACTNLNLYAELVYTEQSNPQYYTALRGRPSDIGGTVGSFQGFTIFSDIHADAINGATDAEKREIEAALKRGVYI